MKRAAAVLVMSVAVCGWAQDASKTAPAAAPAQAAPQGKRPLQAKTQPEFDAYKAAAALTDPAAQEKAADDFATKFPDSELRGMLYKNAMHGYQQANSGDKVMAMAQKVLGLDADDPEALVALAQVMTETTKETDVDHDARIAEARKNAERALVTIDTDVPPGQPPDRLEMYKGFIRSEAYEIMGTQDFNAKNWAAAESNLKKSIDAFPSQPDPVAVYRTAVSLDMQNKYPEAQKYANQAVDLTKEGTPAGDAARKERERLAMLAGGSAPAKN